jgi:PAS domain S-box-containing protein
MDASTAGGEVHREFLRFVRRFPDALLLIDGSGHILAANDAAGEAFGLGAVALEGRALLELCLDPGTQLDDYLARCRRTTGTLAGGLTVRTRGCKAGARYRCEAGALELEGDRPVMMRLRRVDELAARSRLAGRQHELERLKLVRSQMQAALSSSEARFRRLYLTLSRLQRVTAALSSARTPEQVAEVVVQLGVEALGGSAGGLLLISDDRQALEMSSASSYSREVLDFYARIPLDAILPVTEAVRRAEPVLVENRADWLDKYMPQLGSQAKRPPFNVPVGEATAAIPLLAEHPIGAIVISFAERRSFSNEERDFMLALAAHSTHALERARLYASEQAAHRRAAFLSEASAILASSLEYSTTLAAVAKLAIPFVADGCVIEVVERDGAPLQPLAVAHQDPIASARLLELRRAQPPASDAVQGVAAVVRTGHAELYVHLEQAPEGAGWAADPPQRALLGELGVRSCLVAPMAARGRTFGAITLLSSRRRRRYGELDLDMAEELGRRAGLAIENALLFREAREADRRKDEFLAMLGHELRNPLSPIVTALELMRLKGEHAFERERTIIERQVEHVTRLVNDLLDVSRITRGKIEIVRERVALTQVVSKAIEIASPLFEQRVQKLSMDVPSAGLFVDADPVRLTQVIANLLTNAAKYTEPGGHVAVSAARQNGEVVVSVRDDGTGIAPEMLPRIFDLFVQSERGLDRAQGGLGLGLTIVKSLVELHGGSVTARSEGLGQGSTFEVRLPAPAELNRAPAADKAAAGRRSTSSSPAPRILVVDDNVDAVEVLAEALGELGYTVRVAHDGPEALEVVTGFTPEIALLDIGLPVMDGYELAERLRARFGATVRLVALTGYGQDADRARSRAAGFDEHLVKPIELERLERLLVALTERGTHHSDAAAAP